MINRVDKFGRSGGERDITILNLALCSRAGIRVIGVSPPQITAKRRVHLIQFARTSHIVNQRPRQIGLPYPVDGENGEMRGAAV